MVVMATIENIVSIWYCGNFIQFMFIKLQEVFDSYY